MSGATPLPAIVAAHAQHAPDRVAVSGGTDFTYGELDARVTTLSSQLSACGVARGDLVGVHAHRTPETVAALLAILRTGAAFLPLDPEFPSERLAFMLADSGCSTVISDHETNFLPSRVRVLRLTDMAGKPPIGAPSSPRAGNELAYMIYTSGSTGRPKGAMIGGRALAHFATTAPAAYGLRQDDRVLQFFPLSFDGGIEEVSATLGHGATLVLKRHEMTASFTAYERIAAEMRISVMHLPPAFWHAWCEFRMGGGGRPMPFLRLVLLGGETLQERAFRAWHDDPQLDAAVVNVYGATEATMFTTLQVLKPEPAFDQAVGRPLPGTHVHLLDEDLRPVPAGAVGEAFIGGRSVGLGYKDHQRATATSFLPDPFGEPGGRMYRTGDLLRRRPDGALVFVGRRDWQVKVDGFRIDPEEVALTIDRHPSVKECAVLPRRRAGGTTQLIAFVVPRADARLAREDLTRHCAAELPRYMFPTEYVFLDEMPYTPGAKIDRNALASVAGAREKRPRSRAPEVLANLWEQAIHGHDDGATFMEAGGSSIQAMTFVGIVEDVYGIELSAGFVLNATLAQIVSAVEHGAVCTAAGPRSLEAALPWAVARELSDDELADQFEHLYEIPRDD